VSTTLPFGTFVFEHDAFFSGNFDTHFVKNYYTPYLLKERQEADAKLAAIIALHHYLQQQQVLQPVNNKTTSWKRRLAH